MTELIAVHENDVSLREGVLEFWPELLEFGPTGTHLTKKKPRRYIQNNFRDVDKAPSRDGPITYAFDELMCFKRGATKK